MDDFANGNGAALISQGEAAQLLHLLEQLYADELLHINAHNDQGTAFDKACLRQSTAVHGLPLQPSEEVKWKVVEFNLERRREPGRSSGI